MKIKLGDLLFTIETDKIKDPVSFSAEINHILERYYQAHNFYRGMEIKDNLDIESEGSSKKIVDEILSNRRVPETDNEQLLSNLYSIYNITDKNKDITKDNIKILYDLMWMSIKDKKNKLDNHENYWRKEDGQITRTTKNPFLTLDPKYLDSTMDSLITFIQSNELTHNDRLKSIIIMFWFVYAHPYYDYNGKMSRILAGWYLKTKERYLDSMVFSLVFKVMRSSYIDYLTKIRESVERGTKEFDITNIIAKWFDWVSCAIDGLISFIGIQINNGLSLSDKKTAIYLAIYIKSNFSKQKEFTAKDIEEILKLKYSRQNLHSTLDKMVSDGLIIKRKQAKSPVFSVIK